MSKLILGYGLLGKEIHKQSRWDFQYGSMKQLHIPKKYDTVVNCIGYTNTYDNKKVYHWESNLKLVKELIDYCNENNVAMVAEFRHLIFSGRVFVFPVATNGRILHNGSRALG